MKINWRKILKYVTLGLVAVASRSGKVRRGLNGIENYLDLVREIERMAEADGGGRLPFATIRDEFKLSEQEARELVNRFYEYSRLALVITDVPDDGTDKA